MIYYNKMIMELVHRYSECYKKPYYNTPINMEIPLIDTLYGLYFMVKPNDSIMMGVPLNNVPS